MKAFDPLEEALKGVEQAAARQEQHRKETMDLLQELSQQDTAMRLEIVAWRNKFPNLMFNQSTCVLVERPK